MSDTTQQTTTTTQVPPPSWRDSLPDDLKTHSTLSKFSDPATLAKSYVELEKMRGVPADQLLVLPKDQADKDGWSKVFSKLGRPESPDKYSEVKMDLPEGVEFSKEEAALARTKFHELNMTDAQAAGVLGLFGEKLKQGLETSTAAKEKVKQESEALLKKEYGDRYESVIASADNVLKRFGDEAFREKLIASGFANDATMVKFLAGIAKLTAEDNSSIGGKGADVSDAKTKADAKLLELSLDKNFQAALNNPTHPSHDSALKTWTDQFRAGGTLKTR